MSISTIERYARAILGDTFLGHRIVAVSPLAPYPLAIVAGPITVVGGTMYEIVDYLRWVRRSR